ncbi:uracil phosphoribosyltransferase [Streptomyces sp. Agncl-13]|uniref:uracil phosphoribosyltransferase n=1 Tax=Streptomyces sp. Agncl-13 TaxID=3400628 RepID=UPI003A8C2E49
MTFLVETADDEKRYARLAHLTEPGEVRQELVELSGVLGRRTADIVTERFGRSRHVLCVIVLRGGALMYPGFVAAFPTADFCVLGMRRAADRDAVHHEYMTAVPRDAYEVTVYIDCISATGGTLLAVREVIAAHCATGHEVAAVVSGAAAGTDVLRQAGINVVGFSLYEDLDGPVVLPDMGALDAGDLFSGVAPYPPGDGSPR